MRRPRRPIRKRHVARRARPTFRVLPLLAALLVVLIPAMLFARAGGGENYHSGGGGGGGALIYLAFRLIVLCFQHPACGLPVLIALVVIGIYIYRHAPEYSAAASAARSRIAAPDQAARLANVGQIRQQDPAFDEAAFLSRVRTAFVAIQEAWTGQDLSRVRAFISDGVYERFSLQFAGQREAGYRNRLDNLLVEDARVLDVNTDDTFDEVSVLLRARADDYRVSLADGRRVPGPTATGSFTEVWSFLRRRGARTVPGKPGLIEGNCPNCGAAIEMNQSANCAHCKALLRSGEYDWVLSEITQESTWEAGGRGRVPGADELRARDPGFNLQALEDRTSVIFWRLAAAWRTGKTAPLRKMAAPAFCDALEPTLRAPPGGARTFFGECAVGAVTVRGVAAAATAANSESPGDRAVVEVDWSGQRWAAAPGAPPRPAAPDYSTLSTLFVLFRKAGVQTDVAKAVSSAHCPNCGAPESGGASNACDFCGTVLNDGSQGWVLIKAVESADPEGWALLNELRNA